jgi:hypothetical protein
MPRFAILDHDWPTRHWDLLLEDGDVLLSWRLLAEPGVGQSIPAERNVDHRKRYLDYEGPVSGGRGSVTRWDAGTFEWIEKGVEARLIGARISGTIRFTDGECRFV